MAGQHPIQSVTPELSARAPGCSSQTINETWAFTALDGNIKDSASPAWAERPLRLSGLQLWADSMVRVGHLIAGVPSVMSRLWHLTQPPPSGRNDACPEMTTVLFVTAGLLVVTSALGVELPDNGTRPVTGGR
jgi:hypothetical protein